VPDGYLPLASYTYQNQGLLRSILASGSDADVANAVDYGKRIRLYPLSQAADPPATTFVDVADVVFDTTIPYDLRFFESLDRVVQAEPWLPRDKVIIDMLKTIGIEKGKPFQPDGDTRDILEEAAREAHAWFIARFETEFQPYFDGSQWAVTAPPELTETLATFYEKTDMYAVDDRALAYYFMFSGVKHIGTGQFYLFAMKDRQAEFLDGGNSYRLTVPTSVPVRQYWSVVVYDRAAHTLIRDVPRVGLSSQTPGLQQNTDGTVDIYFGPEYPAGKESNWIPTRRARQFEVAFRFYGPESPLFDRTWQLPDVEKV
jgi:hypothetical protein